MPRQRFFRNIDYSMVVSILLLIAVGSLAIYSATCSSGGTAFISRQITWVCIGFGVFFVMSLLDYKAFTAIAPVLYVGVLLLLGSLFIFGRARSGSTSWLSIGSFSLQPSEFAKVVLIITLTRYLVWDYEKRQTFFYIVKAWIIAGIPLALILKQPDLGTALVFIPIIFGMLYAAGARPKYLIMLIIMGIMAVPPMFMFLKEYQKARLLVFINPNIDPLGAGYNIIQSKIAIGSGGLWGKGWLLGTQNRLSFLPERHTDFIFSVIGEEFGLLGATFVLLLFGLILMSCFKAAGQARDVSGRLLVVGVMVYLATHIIINVGMTIGIMPITGLPLPLISYGGSSMIATLAALGLVESVHIRRYMF
ncbi:MAG TPA: rod shape-determining protein RodA [bacterium]|nr:rod shape-determining protein RodA [bacterium]